MHTMKIHNGLKIFTVAVMFAGTALALSDEDPAKAGTLGVCEILSDLGRFSGKTIRVVGRISTSSHGWALVATCPQPFIGEDGRRWPTGINLQTKECRNTPEGQQPECDRVAIARMDRILCFLNEGSADELGVQIQATFVGVLAARRTYRTSLVTPDGVPYGVGFGHLGALPAELVVTGVSGIVVKETDSPK